MVIKVSGQNIYFRGGINNTSDLNAKKSNIQKINEYNTVTYPKNVQISTNIKTPQKYTKISVDKLSNGIEVHSYRLSNGYKVTIVPMEDSPAVVKTYVNVGSMNETPDIKGISHFLEHMAFNGTNGENGHIKLETGDSFKKIEQIGGWTNASTNYAITDYVNSSQQLKNSDLETQIKVIAAMSEDLKLSDAMITKEKGPVCSEINMILDSPQTVAMDQTVRSLFNIKSPADELVGGSVKHIQNLTRKDVMDYYNKYYTPDNTNIVVTGDVNPNEVIELVSKNFTSNKVSNGKKFEEKLNPIQNTIRKDYVSDKATSAEIILGFAGPKNCDAKEKLLYNIAANYLRSNSSNLSKNLKDLNAYYSINSDKISTNPNSPRLSVIEINSSEENSEKALHTVYNVINNLKPITEKELNRIKEAMSISREYLYEHSTDVNDVIGHAVLDGDLDREIKYEEHLDAITPEDVNNAVKKYFDLNKTAITVIHPKNKENVSFKGNNNRKPINTEKIEEIKLNNNIDLGLYKTKSNNFSATISLNTDIPYNKKPAVRDILNEIYEMGTNFKNEDEFNKLLEDNNIDLSRYAGADGISIYVNSSAKNINKALEIAKEVLYSPAINQKNLEKAKAKIKDRLERQEDSAGLLYYNYQAKNNPYAFTDKEKLDALDSITLEDINEFHNYVINNSRGIVTTNIPESSADHTRENIITFANSLNPVMENKIITQKIYKPEEKSTVLTKAKNTNQADIKEVYTFECNNNLKNIVSTYLMRSILSSSSIGLFDNLREKQHLAYSVYADLSKDFDKGELSLNILTTTDNKDTGEQSFDNVRKSIDGFHNQIKELLSGKFTDEDLENAKLSYKAMLLDNEGNIAKVDAIDSGLDSIHGIEYKNKIYEQIDSISREDIINIAQKVFSSKPVYSIVATQDTLDANKDYLQSLTV